MNRRRREVPSPGIRSRKVGNSPFLHIPQSDCQGPSTHSAGQDQVFLHQAWQHQTHIGTSHTCSLRTKASESGDLMSGEHPMTKAMKHEMEKLLGPQKQGAAPKLGSNG